MATYGPTLLIVMLAAVLLVLIAGIIVMLRGGDIARKYGNRLMRLRVILQGLAIVLLGLLFFAAR